MHMQVKSCVKHCVPDEFHWQDCSRWAEYADVQSLDDIDHHGHTRQTQRAELDVSLETVYQLDDGNSHCIRHRNHPSQKLREYGLQPCSWMKKRPALRYPRVPSAFLPTAAIRLCINKLWQWQEQGEIFFMLMEGSGLGAVMAGGFHGGRDDPDLDVKMYSRLNKTLYQHCSPTRSMLGSYGYVTLPSLSSSAEPNEEMVKKIKADFSDVCICEYEGHEIPCRGPKDTYMQRLMGGSWWVPPVSGGKNTGFEFKEWFQPGSVYYPLNKYII